MSFSVVGWPKRRWNPGSSTVVIKHRLWGFHWTNELPRTILMGAFAPDSRRTRISSSFFRYFTTRSISSIEKIIGVFASRTWMSNESQMLPAGKLMTAAPYNRAEPMPKLHRAVGDVSKRIYCPISAQYGRYYSGPALLSFAAAVSTIKPLNFSNHCLFRMLEVRTWETMAFWS